MTSPNPTPRGADAAQERNAAAVRRLDDQGRPSVGAAIHEMLAAVLTSLDSGPQTPSVESLTSAARSAWRAAVDRIIGWVRTAFTRLVGQAADNLPDDTAPVLAPATLEQRVDAIAAQLVDALSEVPDVLAARVATALRDGWARGESPEQLRARVALALGRDQWDAEIERIVRTTTTTVYNAAHAAAADALEIELGTPLRRIWLASRDDRTRPTHRAAHAQVVDSGQPFLVGGHRLRYPGDPLGPVQETVNCFPGWTRVATTSPVRHVYRRWYEGPMVRIEARGAVQLTVTPNHPVLTDFGWKAAKDIQLGDKLIGSGGSQWSGAAVPEVQDVPATFEQIHRAAMQSGVTARVVSGSVVFHGDAVADSEVEVVPVDLALWSEDDAPLAKHLCQAQLPGLGHGPGLLAHSRPRLGSDELGSVPRSGQRTGVGPSASFVGGSGEGLAFLQGHALHPQPAGGADVADGHARLRQAAADHDAVDPEGSGDGQFGLASDVPTHDFGIVHREPVAAPLDARCPQPVVDSALPDAVLVAEALDRSPGKVALRDVVSVDVLEFLGHVYNLETESGWYVADSIASSNCRCVHTAVVNDMVIDLAHRVQGQEADVLTELAEQNEPGATTAAADGLAAVTRMPPQLITYWTRGEGAARIRWGSEGDFTRCTRALRRYLDPGEVEGACANLHRRATGKWPAEKGAADDENEGDGMPCPCESTPSAARADDGAVTAITLEEAQTMAMVALVPAEEDAARLAVEGGTPASELHVTLLFLGDAEPWRDSADGEALIALAERVAADVGPITGHLWARAQINPEADPVAAYLVGDDTGRLAELQAGVLMATSGLPVPAQHGPFVPHISTRYGSADTAGMDAVGTDVVLDRIRVEIGDQVTDFPLTGDDSLDLDLDDDEDGDGEEVDVVMVDDTGPVAPVEPASAAAAQPVVAAAAAPVDDPTPPPPVTSPTATAAPNETVLAAPAVAPVGAEGAVVASQIRAADDVLAVVAQAVANAPAEPPRRWFEPIEVDGPTPPTITAQGRVWGHIGQAGVCHAGIDDRCVTIPRTRTNFGAFHRGELLTAEGDAVQVGYLYTGCDHSALDLTMDEAREHLDAACVRTAAGRVYDTEWGPMFVGSLVPGVTAEDVQRLYKLSGEWFTAPLELHAAIGVDDAGFPVDGTGDAIRVSEVDPAPLAADTRMVATAVVDEIERRAVVREAEAVALAATRRQAARATRAVTGYQRRGQ